MDDDDGGNPFSFSMFLKKKEQGDGDEEDIVVAKGNFWKKLLMKKLKGVTWIKRFNLNNFN